MVGELVSSLIDEPMPRQFQEPPILGQAVRWLASRRIGVCRVGGRTQSRYSRGEALPMCMQGLVMAVTCPHWTSQSRCGRHEQLYRDNLRTPNSLARRLREHKNILVHILEKEVRRVGIAAK